MTIANHVDCAGPILDYCDNNTSYTEYYLPLLDTNGGEIKEKDLIKWINFINKTGLNILYCGVVYRKDLMEEFYLCVIHNKLIHKSFPKLENGIKFLNLMSVQALRFIQYYPEMVEYSYLINKELKDAYLSIQIAHYKYLLNKKGDLSSTYTWIDLTTQPLFKSNTKFKKLENIVNINYLFWLKLKDCYYNYNYKISEKTKTDNNKTMYKLLLGWIEFEYSGNPYKPKKIEHEPVEELVNYLNNNEFKNFIKYFENE